MIEAYRPPSWLDRSVHFAVRQLVWLGMRLWFRLRIVNRPRLSGGFVVVANHSSLLDPLVLGTVVPGWRARRVVFLMSTAFARSRSMGWFYRWNRVAAISMLGRNREAMRIARSALAAGEPVGVFPEGGLSRDGEPLLGNPGAIALVLAGEVPIVPCGIVGANRALPPGAALPRPRRVELRFGRPIPVAELVANSHRKEALQNATSRIMREIANLTGQVAREDALNSARS